MLLRKTFNFRNVLSNTSCLYFSSKAAAKKERVPIITCKRKEHNLYLDQVKPIKPGEEILLASKGWQHHKSKGDYFTIHPTRNADDVLKDGTNFSELPLNKQLVKNLEDFHDITVATKLQTDAMKEIFNDQHVLMAAETGCGKTHAYLVPLIQKLLKEKAEGEDRQFNTPLTLILTPARELAEQIGKMARELTHNLDINVKVLVGGNTKKKLMNPKFEDVDILIGSVGVISKLTTSGIFRMEHVQHVVLDESDTFLDMSFNDKMSYFLRRFPFHRSTQLILVSATMPTSIEDVFRSIVDTSTLRHVVSEDLHKILPYVTQKFMRMNKTGRPEHLLRIVRTEIDKRRPVIVFSNKTPTCDFINIFLNNNGVECVRVNGDMNNFLRIGQLDRFQNGEVHVLSTTDCLGRGINTLRAKNIINFDFPMYIADYIHRCGRIGRLGGQDNGIVTNFISSLAEIDLVRKIELTARTGNVLENVDANIGKIIKTKIEREIARHENSLIRSMKQ